MGAGMSTTQMFEQGLKFHTMIKFMILINYSKKLILFFLDGHGHEHHSIYEDGHTFHTTIKFFDVIPDCCEERNIKEVSVLGDAKYNQPCTENEEVDTERKKK
jgi:hypothetical protein